jgi:5-methylcytosine-specific restriction endonuclease McrA
MSENPSTKWFWNDWVNDRALALCSLAAQGLWMRMLAIASQSGGYIRVNGRQCSTEDISVLVGRPLSEVAPLIAELEARGVFSRTRDGTCYNRRMVRDEKLRKLLITHGRKGGNPNVIKGTVPKEQRVRPFKKSDNPAKTAAILAKSGGRCHWCGVTLRIDGKDLHTDSFHVDHVVAVRDGGKNNVENLVASCAQCNHARARKHWQNSPDTNPDGNPHANPDTKPSRARAFPIPFKNSKEESSEAIASEAATSAATIDPTRAIFDRGLAILGPKRRSLLGKLCKAHGEPAVLEAIVACETEQPIEPAAFLLGCLARYGPKFANGHRISPASTQIEGFHLAAEKLIRDQGNSGVDRAPDEPLLDG